MLRVTIELVPGGVGDPRRVGVAIIGQTPLDDPADADYVAALWDDRQLTTPTMVAVNHDPADGVWQLVRVATEAAAEGSADLAPATRALLHQHVRDRSAPTATPPPNAPEISARRQDHRPRADPGHDVMRRELKAIAEYARRQIEHAREVGWASQERTWFHVLQRTTRALDEGASPDE